MSDVRIVRMTATKNRPCASSWECAGVQQGTRSAFVSGIAGATPMPWCEPCAEKLEAGEQPPPFAAAIAARLSKTATSAGAAAPPPAEVAPTAELCPCVNRADGFTDRGDGLFVHARCGLPAALAEQGSAAASMRTPAANGSRRSILTGTAGCLQTGPPL